MNNYIYTNNNSLPHELCDEIIEYFNEEEINWSGGITAGGLNKKVKDTSDFTIPLNVDCNNKWFKINNVLSSELYYNLHKYITRIENWLSNDTTVNYKIFDRNCFKENVFMIQKYEKAKGKYVYHNDFAIKDDSHRVITYLWYLNDVEKGGETEFWHDLKIKPEKGKLMLFPCHYAFPHCGIMPISSDKIIITGWLHV